MSKYKIVLMKPARKFIEKQTPNQQERILKAIYKLPDDGDIKGITNQNNKYRLRIGSIRVIYTIKDDILTIEVLNAGNRGDVYK